MTRLKKLLVISCLGVAVLLGLGGSRAVSLLFSANYLPHRFCYLAQPGLVWTNVAADGLIALSYFVIFGCLLWIAVKVRRVDRIRQYVWIFVSFAMFIAACGATHLAEVVTVWWPVYPLAAVIKVVCMVASVPTAILFGRATPKLAWDLPRLIHTLESTQAERDEARLDLSVAETEIAARKRAEAELVATNERMNHIMDSTSEGIFKIQADWTVMYANRASREILPDLQTGKTYWECFPTVLGTDVEQHLRRTMAQKVNAEWENYYEPYQAWYAVHAYPSEGGISIFFVPITARKMLEQQLETERMLREKRIEALSVMAGGLAHEISNPLAIIHGTASDLLRIASEKAAALNAEEVLKASQSIVFVSERASRILRGLRGFAREAGSDPRELASIYDIVEEAVQLQEMRFERHRVELRVELEPGIPPLLCREVQVGQIITNLLNNAFDAITQERCPELWIALEVTRQGDQVQIDVVDSGLGIAPEVRRHLMDPFFSTKQNLGMGVGLSLSRAIAKEHGGSLELSSDQVPTRFRLLLPIAGLGAAGDAIEGDRS